MEPPYSEQRATMSRRQCLPGSLGDLAKKLSPLSTSKHNGLKIDIDQHFTSKRYRPGSEVKGNVKIYPRKEVRLEDISIELVCRSTVQNTDRDFYIEASNLVLNLSMPVIYPSPRLLLPDQEFVIPFDFVIPYQVGSAACTHTITSEAVRQEHSQLPPSISGWEYDDMTPKGVRIEYAIHAIAFALPAKDNLGSAKPIKLEAKKTIQVLPFCSANPPLVVPLQSSVYCLKSTQKMRNRPFSRAIGQLKLSADQPQAFNIDQSGQGIHPSFLIADLSFEPFGKTPALPDFCSLSVTLESDTWFADKPMSGFADLVHGKDLFQVSEVLLTKHDTNLEWERLSSLQNERDPQDREVKPTLFKSVLEIRMDHFISQKRIFLPTFHSCLTARTYKLRLLVDLGSASLQLQLPVQLCTAE